MQRNPSMNNDFEKPPVITIIIPVYQAAKYLRQCLDSVLLQSFTDWELLLIDDGSNDGSEIICDEYAGRDARIHAFHQKNAGQSAARNFGLDHARGEYITMIDADDLLLSRRYLEVLYRSVVEHKAQAGICGCKEIEQDEFPDMEEEVGEKTVVSGKDIFRGAYMTYGMQMSVPFLKLYHSSCFNNVRYPEGRRMEDVATMHNILYPCDRIVVIDSQMYGYRKNPEGTMKSTRKSILFYDILAANEDRKNYFISVGDDKAYEYTCREFQRVIITYYINTLADGSTDDILAENRPSPSDMHMNYNNKGRIHRFFLGYDPDLKQDYTRSFFEKDYPFLETLLRAARAVALGESACSTDINQINKTPENTIRVAKNQKLDGLICDLFLETTDPDSREHDACDNNNNRLFREYIIREKKMQDSAASANDPNAAAVNAMDGMLTSLYSKPWLRNSESSMIPNGFLFRVAEKQRPFFEEVSKRVLDDKKMTEIDCALYLLAVIDQCPKRSGIAGLNDLLDLHILFIKSPVILETDAFKDGVGRLKLNDTLETFLTLTEKLFSEENQSSYDIREMKMMAFLLR